MKKKEYIERYGEEAWGEYLKKCKAYRAAHREERIEKMKVYDAAHTEEQKAYREAHREERKAYDAARHSTPQGRAKNLLKRYRWSDKMYNRGETSITADWIQEHIFTSSCTYCGETDWHKLGTDRIDNTKPHTPDNCICACGKCNNERADKYSVEEFSVLKRETLKGQASGPTALSL